MGERRSSGSGARSFAVAAVGAMVAALCLPVAVGVPASASGSTALFVAGTPTLYSGDRPVEALLTDLGYDVTVVDDDIVAAGDELAHDLLVISNSVVPSKVGSKFANSSVPTVTWEGYLFDDMGFVVPGGATGETTGQVGLDVVAPTHEIVVAAGVGSGIVDVARTPTNFSFGEAAAGAQVIATRVGDPGRASLYVFDTDDELSTGETPPARRAALWMGYSAPRYLTADGFALFDATIDWLTAGGSGPGGNGDPVLGALVGRSDVEGGAVSVVLEAADPDAGDVLTWSASGLPGGLSIDPVGGEISGVVSQTAAEGSPFVVVVTVDDGRGGSDSGSFEWVIDAVDVDPVVEPMADRSDAEGASVSVGVVAGDADGDVLTYTASGLPAGLSIDSGTGLISGTIAAGAGSAAPYAVVVGADDGSGPVSVGFSWDVDVDVGAGVLEILFVAGSAGPPSKDRPIRDHLVSAGHVVTVVDDDAVVAADAVGMDLVLVSTSINVGNASSLAVLFGSLDVPVGVWEGYAFDEFGMGSGGGEDGNQTALTVVASGHEIAVAAGAAGSTVVASGPSGFSRMTAPAVGGHVVAATSSGRAALVVYEQGTVASARRAALWFSWATGPVTNSDGFALFDATIDWLTAGGSGPGGNGDPVLGALVGRSDVEGGAVSVVLEAADPDAGDVLTWSASGLPGGLSIDPVGGEISGVVSQTAAEGSPFVVVVTVDDGRGGSDSGSFEWVIDAVDVDPVVEPMADRSDAEGASVSVGVVAGDADGDVLTYTASGLPAGLSIDSGTGLISGTIAAGAGSAAPYAVVVGADDGSGPVSVGFSWDVDVDVGAGVLEILFVAGSAGPPSKDRPIRDHLVSAGHVVTVVDDDAVVAADAVGMDLVLVSTSINVGNASSLAVLFGSLDVPVGVWEGYAFDEFGMGSGGGEDGNQTALTVVASGHEIAVAAGAAGSTVVASGPSGFSRMTAPAVGGHVVAATSSGRAALVAYEQGTVASARRAALWFSWATGPVTNSDGFALFDATIDWLAGTPNDGGGNTGNAPPKIVTGNVAFTKSIIGTGVKAHSVASGDLDGDGDQDAVAADNLGGIVYWYENDGVGNFTRHIIDDDLDDAYPVGIEDVDLDGSLDVLAGGYVADAIIWYQNDGTGTFTRHVIDDGADGAHSAVTADLDGDGDRDILAANQDGNEIAWYVNDGDQSFTKIVINSSATAAKRAEAADLDGDGDLDIVTATLDLNEIAWFENDGAQNFTKHVVDTTVIGAYYATAADMNGDGHLDILSASKYDSVVAWYEGDGNGGFTYHHINNERGAPRIALPVDIDGDGDLDVLTTAKLIDTVAWYDNDGSGNFTKRIVDSTGDGPYGASAADFDGDGDIDVLQGTVISYQLSLHRQIRQHAAVVGRGATLLIDASRLRTVDEDDDPSALTYMVTNAPSAGGLRLDGVPLTGSTFTQRDVDLGRVTYVHGGSGGTADGFSFTVADWGGGGVHPATGTFSFTIVDVP